MADRASVFRRLLLLLRLSPQHRSTTLLVATIGAANVAYLVLLYQRQEQQRGEQQRELKEALRQHQETTLSQSQQTSVAAVAQLLNSPSRLSRPITAQNIQHESRQQSESSRDSRA